MGDFFHRNTSKVEELLAVDGADHRHEGGEMIPLLSSLELCNENEKYAKTFDHIAKCGSCGDSSDEEEPILQKPLEQERDEPKIIQTRLSSLLRSFCRKMMYCGNHPKHVEDDDEPIPKECQLFIMDNIAVVASYLLVGILQGLSGVLLNVYPIDLQATEAQQISIASIRSLPASFKIIFGFLSDNFPIMGKRRKPYMLLGWLLSSCSILSLLFTADTSLYRQHSEHQQCSVQNAILNTTTTLGDDDTAEFTPSHTMIPANAPSIPMLSLCIFGFGFGFWFADVMADAIVAEKSKLEPPSQRGQIQSTCYAYRFFGMMIAAPLSTWLYNHNRGPQIIFWLMAMMPMGIIPLVLLYKEPSKTPDEIPSTQKQCKEIYDTVCSRAVWQPMAFVYLYNVLQIGNAAWKQFLKTALDFTSCQLNMLYVVSTSIVYLGIVTYKQYMIHWSWRNVYIFTTLLNVMLSSLQILLILDITFGVSYFLFALGDDVFQDFVAGIQFLPLTIMMVHLCPVGSEGASYAMFTTVHNAALVLSLSLSTALLGIWDVGKEALEANNYDGMIRLTVLTTVSQTSGILFVRWLPHNQDDLQQLKVGYHNKSHIGGTVVLFIICLSLFNAIRIGLFNIIKPGWMGES